MANTKPPMKSMMTGSANEAMILLCDRGVPTLSPVIMNLIPLSEVHSNISTMMPNEVAHDETTSITHISVAKAKMAMIRCWITVRPSIP